MSAGGAVAAGAVLQAVRASGVVVRVGPEEFLRLLYRRQAPLVVRAAGAWLFGTFYQYLAPYKGLAFYAKSSSPLDLPPACEIVPAGSVWAPG